MSSSRAWKITELILDAISQLRVTFSKTIAYEQLIEVTQRDLSERRGDKDAKEILDRIMDATLLVARQQNSLDAEHRIYYESVKSRARRAAEIAANIAVRKHRYVITENGQASDNAETNGTRESYFGQHEKLRESGFQQLQWDNRMYVKPVPGGGYIIIGVTVDDIWVRLTSHYGQIASSFPSTGRGGDRTACSIKYIEYVLYLARIMRPDLMQTITAAMTAIRGTAKTGRC